MKAEAPSGNNHTDGGMFYEEDPFYSRFEKQYDVLRGMGIPVKRIVLNGWSHGFGADGGWVSDYGQWLTEVFHVSTDAEKEQGNQ